ncbi:MAG TPA: iron-sulfur cluster assembly scaffold protein [Thermoanaerobaculia bacterium]
MIPYGEVIHDHSRRPRNVGSLDAPDIRREGFNPFCGDRVRVELALGTDGTVQAARFQGDLCVIAKAAASVLTELVIGLPIEGARDLPEGRLLEALGAEIQPARRKCALLAFETLQSGIKESGR